MPNLPHPFPQLIPARVAAALRRLEERLWRDPRALAVEVTEPTVEHQPLARIQHATRRPAVRGEVWGRLYDQRWARLSLPTVPASTYLQWIDEGEATLWVDGVPHYGFDVAHRRAPLPVGPAREVWIECYCCQSAFWHPDAKGLSPHGSVLTGATLLRRDDEVWAAYHDLKCLYDLALAERPDTARFSMFGFQPTLWRAPVLLRRLLRALNEAIDAFDTADVPGLRASLAAAYVELRDDQPLVRATLTGHAHLDLVWLWPERMGEAKAVHTLASVNRLMDAYPEFRFAYSQPASYEAVARRAPTLAQAIRGRIHSGQWQPTGALYVESDTLLACGEALARSFTLGQAAFAALRGAPTKLAWLPDVFGYSGCLPQIMRLSGVESFFTTKLTWSAVNRFPFSSFVWRGTDGSEVLTHVTQETGYSCAMQIDELRAGAEGHAQSDVHPEFLQPTGYGDGGGGPTEEMCERVRRFSALRGLPAPHWDHPEAFFARLAALRPQLPVYQGECYLEYHRGTYTTQAAIKSTYRALERALQAREAALVARGAGSLPEDLAAAWRRAVFAQFHDCLPGSSVPDVYAEILPELAALTGAQQTATTAVLTDAAGSDCLFNPLPVARTVLHEGRLLALPPLGGVALSAPALDAPAAVTVRDGVLGNGRVAARVDADGHLAELVVEGRPVAFAGVAGRLVTYADKPSAFDAWDIDRHTLALATPVATPATVRAEPDAIVVQRAIGQGSRIELRYALVPGESVLRLRITLDWHEAETLLKLHFPTAYAGESVRCGAPFGTILRSQLPGMPQAEAMWEMPVSRHVALTDAGEREGFFIVTESKYGVSCRSGDVGLSLVRSPVLVGYEGHRPAYPTGLSRHVVERPYTDLGAHRIDLALGVIRPELPLEEQPAALADLLFTPPVPYRGRPFAAALRGVKSDSLWPCWAKPGADGTWTLRLHELLGRRGVAELDVAPGWTVEPVNLRDVPLGPPLSEGRIAYRPNQIVSLRFRPNPPVSSGSPA
ncbi:alpha-mannosidase [Opitutus sp. ER46]|uniref:alpha-mannosidase n=1 Tax=Opitutus sp. ER46 TaxID=2161864 RepID=UPI000D31D775|nr:alpha-mannosidase [Opitutus sp. ER46]PTX98426.1 alpha-mannosidase [Opitutus sp. ER46]